MDFFTSLDSSFEPLLTLLFMPITQRKVNLGEMSERYDMVRQQGSGESLTMM